MKTRQIAWTGLLLAALACQTPDPSARLWGGLEPGTHAVGLRQLTFVDSTRPDPRAVPRSPGRHLEVILWYPARGDRTARTLGFRDYVRLIPRFRDQHDPEALGDWLAAAVTGDTSGLDADARKAVLDTRMRGAMDLPTSDGSFPLVLWTIRHETEVAQSVLSEYLASHGYVVAVARHRGTPLPLPWTLPEAAEKQATFETLVEDLRFALGRLKRETLVDSSKIAVLTWSYAAEQAARMQMEEPNVRLVMGLSSDPLASTGVYQGEDAASRLDRSKLTAPYVLMAELRGFDGAVREPPAVLRSLQSRSYFVSFRDLAHGNFNVLEGMLPGVFDVETVQPWSKGGALAQQGYETVCRYALALLKHHTGAVVGPEEIDSIWDAERTAGRVTVSRFGAVE